MAIYRVLDVPKPFGGCSPGALVELTEKEASGFFDKLEPVDDSTGNTPPGPSGEKTQRERKRKQ